MSNNQKKHWNSVFVSYSHKDEEMVKTLVDEIENSKVSENNVNCWYYARDNPHGNRLAIARDILDKCDQCMVILTENSKVSNWVSREVSYILQRRKSLDSTDYPRLIGVPIFNETAENPNDWTINLRDFDRDEPIIDPITGQIEVYKFGEDRCFNRAENIDDLVRSLSPQVTLIKPFKDKDKELLRNSFDLYKDLFELHERETEEDIERWLEACHEQEGTPEYYDGWGVIHIGCHPIGFCYLSVNSENPLWYASYWGADKDFRQGFRSEILLKNIFTEISEFIPSFFQKDISFWKGVVFEVEMFDYELLLNIAKCFTTDDGELSIRNSIITHDWFVNEKLPEVRNYLISNCGYDVEKLTSDKIFATFTKWRRFYFYDRQPTVFSVTDEKGEPVTIMSPAIRTKFDQNNNPYFPIDYEHKYFLMVNLFDRSFKDSVQFTYGELISYINDTFYFEAHGMKDEIGYIPGYENYYADFKQRLSDNIGKSKLAQAIVLSGTALYAKHSMDRQRINEFGRGVLEKISPEKYAL